MSLIGRPADQDPLDLSRLMARDALSKILRYTQLALEMVEDRDDDGARQACRGLVAHVEALKTSFHMLGAARSGEPHRAAVTKFSGPIRPVEQPEDDAA